MKNIFILPTTEPSQVYLVKSTNALGFTSGNPEFMEHYGSGTHNQHIYITNKDLYDKGDWLKNVTIEADPPFKFDSQGIIRITQNVPVGYEYEKIILTSNQKLVADGVAEIDFEFLKSLKDKKLDDISNVKVEKTPLLSNNGRALFGYKYTPTIPKKNIVVLAGEDAISQEFEQIDQNNPMTRGSTALVYKQELERGITITHVGQKETLEQVAERILANNIDGLRDALKDDDLFFFYKGVIQCYGEAMAEWQQQNSYSEADMIEASKYGYNFHKTTQFPEQDFEDSCIRNTQQWLTKFKKETKC